MLLLEPVVKLLKVPLQVVGAALKDGVGAPTNLTHLHSEIESIVIVKQLPLMTGGQSGNSFSNFIERAPKFLQKTGLKNTVLTSNFHVIT